jgi:hypothetical protein
MDNTSEQKTENQEKKKNTANLFHINSIFMFFTKVQTIVDLFDICK